MKKQEGTVARIGGGRIRPEVIQKLREQRKAEEEKAKKPTTKEATKHSYDNMVYSDKEIYGNAPEGYVFKTAGDEKKAREELERTIFR